MPNVRLTICYLLQINRTLVIEHVFRVFEKTVGLVKVWPRTHTSRGQGEVFNYLLLGPEAVLTLTSPGQKEVWKCLRKFHCKQSPSLRRAQSQPSSHLNPQLRRKIESYGSACWKCWTIGIMGKSRQVSSPDSLNYSPGQVGLLMSP